MGYIERKSLKWVNDYRVTYGADPLAKLPRGIKRDPHGCVVYRALEDVDPGNAVSGDTVDLRGSTIITPWYVRLMIISFDLGFRPKQDAKFWGRDKIVYAKDVMTWRDKLEMWRERRRVEKEMRAEREKERLEALAVKLALRSQWEANYTDVWAEEHLKPVITDDLQALYEMESFQKEEEKVVV